MKNKPAMENFSGYSVNAIQQDFWATVTPCNLCAIARNETNEKVKEEREGKGTKYEYVPNVNQVIGSVKDVLIAACITTSAEEREVLMRRPADEITHSLVPLRPGRSTPRPNNPRKSKFHHNQKLNC